ncbi:MAG TPA: inositol monophosphatase, partial [Candidatus Hydrogenedens sp.]|nr:inositol monophosphatase [Candidatus Hydrogenedens sp.]
NYPENYEGRAWIIDPIDGTGNFVRSYFPAFAVAIAFANKRELLSSGVLVPITGDMFFAEKGSGAFCNGNKIQVSKKERLSESCMHLDFGRRLRRKERLPYFIEPLLAIGQIRCIGSAISSLVQVSMGIADGYIHPSLQPWDYVSGQLILEEAGGKITQTDGSPLQLFSDNKGIIASNGYIHDELLQVINKSLEEYEGLGRI